MFVTLQDGLSSLIDALAARLPPEAVQLNASVARIERRGDGWQMGLRRNAECGMMNDECTVRNAAVISEPSVHHSSFRIHRSAFDALILAVPAPTAAKLLQPLDAELAVELASIAYAGTAIVSLGYAADQIGHPLDGMGVVVPSVERSPILACSFSSRKYPHRAPDGKELLRVFVGGARRPELAEMDDDRLRTLVLDSLTRLLHISGEPCYCSIAHWPGTMPQYHVGHRELVDRIEARAAALPHFALAGNAYRGVGLPDCIRGGELAAEKVLAAAE